jgi:branched-chain amino acid transport system ATP-binding protein
MAPALETRGLIKRFGGLVATDNVSFTLEQGARHALIGPNGAGKTTFINLLTGVLTPTSGQILLEGEDITKLRPELRVQRGLARTFQINQLFPAMTPLETLGLAVSERMGGGRDWWRVIGSKREIVDEIVEIAQRFRLTDVLDERTSNLAYGKQRLLEIAVAFACRPRVLLLDEPAAGVPEARTARHGGRPSARCVGPADRARYGSGLQLCRPDFGSGERGIVYRGHRGGGLDRSACPGGVSRGERR